MSLSPVSKIYWPFGTPGGPLKISAPLSVKYKLEERHFCPSTQNRLKSLPTFSRFSRRSKTESSMRWQTCYLSWKRTREMQTIFCLQGLGNTMRGLGGKFRDTMTTLKGLCDPSSESISILPLPIIMGILYDNTTSRIVKII